MTPRLFPWGPRTLYLGPSQRLSPHRNAVACLALGLEAVFEVSNNPEDDASDYRHCRSVLVYPSTLHHFRDARGVMAFLYLDVLSTDLEHIGSLMRARDGRAAFDLACEHEVIAVLRSLWQGDTTWPQARAALARDLLGSPRPRDRRIKEAVRKIAADPAGRPSAAELARAAKLSESRFLHLFARETGVPLRRYRLWCAMGAALKRIAEGVSLTGAALEAGFSSSAHFSAAFRDMFGMEPSRLARAGLSIDGTRAARASSRRRAHR
jgi:AraC-like DNA-binding protein